MDKEDPQGGRDTHLVLGLETCNYSTLTVLYPSARYDRKKIEGNLQAGAPPAEPLTPSCCGHTMTAPPTEPVKEKKDEEHRTFLNLGPHLWHTRKWGIQAVEMEAPEAFAALQQGNFLLLGFAAPLLRRGLVPMRLIADCALFFLFVKSILKDGGVHDHIRGVPNAVGLPIKLCLCQILAFAVFCLAPQHQASALIANLHVFFAVPVPLPRPVYVHLSFFT
jgi:hypothetical protein